MSREPAMHDRPMRMGNRDADLPERLGVGDEVEVFSGYEHTWSNGFSVAEVLQGDRYRLRRSSDGALLPDPTGTGDLRRRPHAGPR